ncbi:DUF4935 domain-containing protein [Candidatus Woesearchaeota archaeon]|nr:DUF4935 domain-containing protein [Candidatus Woesearchaeota archaeon]
MKNIYKPIAAIVDTNTVFSKSLESPIADGFINKWNEIKTSNPAYILLAPDVVVLERTEQRFKIAKESRNNAQKSIKNFNTVTGRNRVFDFSDKKLRDSVESTMRKVIIKYFDEIVETPLDAIDWKDVYNACIRRIPPFSDDDTEKGFKDRLILETIAITFSDKSIQYDIVAVTNDGLLGDAIRARFNNKIEVVDSLKALESYDRLRKDEHASKVAATLLRKARSKFYSSKDLGCLWIKEKLNAYLMSNYGEKLRPENLCNNIFGTEAANHRWNKYSVPLFLDTKFS